MDIEYIHKNDIHEKYLLNKLDAEEQAEYEKFLKENPAVQRELEEVRKFFLQIRATGSDLMRREIEEQVRQIKNPQTDWSILYKAAAVLFLFVLLPTVLYYQFKKPQSVDDYLHEEIQLEEQIKGEKSNGELAPEDLQIKNQNIEIKDTEKEAVVQGESGELKKSRSNIEMEEKQNSLRTESEKTILLDDASGGKGGPSELLNQTFSGSGKAARSAPKITPSQNMAGRMMASEPSREKEILEKDAPESFADEENAGEKGMVSEPLGLEPEEIKLLPIKKNIFKINDKNVELYRFQNNRLSNIDSLKTEIELNEFSPVIKLTVPDQLWNVEKEKITLTQPVKNQVNIIFGEMGIYKVFLGKDTHWSYKVK